MVKRSFFVRTLGNPVRRINIFPVILSGGRSTRMKSDKRFLCLKGSTLLENTILLAREFLELCQGEFSEKNGVRFNVGKVLMSLEKNCIQQKQINSILKKYEIGAASCATVVCIPDILEGIGPLGGVHAVCEYLRNENGVESQKTPSTPQSSENYLVIYPIDMPRLKSDDLKNLLSESIRIMSESWDNGSSSIVVRYANIELPFVLVLKSSENPLTKFFKLYESRSLHSFQEFLGAMEVNVSTSEIQSRIRTNLNHLYEYQSEKRAYEITNG